MPTQALTSGVGHTGVVYCNRRWRRPWEGEKRFKFELGGVGVRLASLTTWELHYSVSPTTKQVANAAPVAQQTITRKAGHSRRGGGVGGRMISHQPTLQQQHGAVPEGMP